MILWTCLLCLRFTIVNIAAQSTINGNSNETCQGYPLLDSHLESQGIYTGFRVPDKMHVFEVREKSVLTVDSLLGSNETIVVRKTETVRDVCPMTNKTLSPTLTELLQDWEDSCFTGPSQGSRDIYSFLGRTEFMAVWTYLVPAKQCFGLQFIIRVQQGRSDHHSDRLSILDGELSLPVVIKSGLYEYEITPQNDTTTVSVVYFYTSLSRSVYWKVAPSLKTSDCLC